MQLSKTQQEVFLRAREISMEIHDLREARDSISVGATHFNLLLSFLFSSFSYLYAVITEQILLVGRGESLVLCMHLTELCVDGSR